MTNTLRKRCILLGLLLIAAALCFLIYNKREADLAAQSAEQALQKIADLSPAPKLSPKAEPTQKAKPSQETASPSAIPTVTPTPIVEEMPAVDVDGIPYVGVLELPSLGLSLPVIDQISKSNLRQAPCRYQGSAYVDNLIIAAHNYQRHFGGLKTMQIGDEITFTDMNEQRFSYTVSRVEELEGTAVEEMEAGDWDLTLFTCTLGGQKRVVVRCKK